ncbi:MAG: efflux RND transporter periplasmic adaptor subunit, partial [Cyanobacteria bacterium P01_F01_bin.116]
AILDDSVLQRQIAQAEAKVVSDTALITQAKAEASEAEAVLDEAIDNLSRYAALFEQGAISEEDLTNRRTQVTTARQTLTARNAAIDSAKASANSQQAEVSQLLAQLNQTQVLAPANGIIAERNATLGDIASTANSIFQLISDGELELEVKIPQSQLNQIDIGAPAEIRSNSDPSLQFQGSVRSINPTVETETRQATLNISLPSHSRLRPGMFLQATIITTNRQGVAIPFTAVLPQDNGEFIVYLLNADDTVQVKTVELGERIPANEGTSDQIEIISGLQADTSVVMEGAAYLQDGDRILIVGEE